MSDSPKRKLASLVIARSDATKQSQFIALPDRREIARLTDVGRAAVIRQQVDSLAKTAPSKPSTPLRNNLCMNIGLNYEEKSQYEILSL